MKKVIYLILLIFPIIILGVVFISSTIIARQIPIAVTHVEISPMQKEIISPELNSSISLDVAVYPSGAYNKNLSYISSDSDVVSVDKSGNLTFLNYGYAVVTVITEDGNYTDECDILIGNPNDNPLDIKSVVPFYRYGLNDNYIFGSQNQVTFSYKVFPKTAENNLVFNLDGEKIQTSSQTQLTIKLKENAKNQLTASSVDSQNNKTTFDLFAFNCKKGYNVNASTTENQLSEYLLNFSDIYLLSDIEITSPITVQNSTIFGNEWKINHSKMPHYLDESLNGNVKAINLQENATLDSVRVVGAITEDRLVYNRVHNVGLQGNNAKIINCIIENGKYNVSAYGTTDGKSGKNMTIENTSLIGSGLANIQVNSGKAQGRYMVGAELNICDLFFDYSYVGILLENNYLNSNEIKGVNIVNVLPSKTQGKSSLETMNWRNLDEGANTAESLGLNYILDEVKNMNEIVYKDEYNDYYVNVLAVKVGGANNFSEFNIDSGDLDTAKNYHYVLRQLNALEALQVGGKHPFEIWCLKPEFYS